MSTVFYGYKTTISNLGKALMILKKQWEENCKWKKDGGESLSYFQPVGFNVYKIYPTSDKVYIGIHGFTGRGKDLGHSESKVLQSVYYDNRGDGIPTISKKDVYSLNPQNTIMHGYFNKVTFKFTAEFVSSGFEDFKVLLDWQYGYLGYSCDEDSLDVNINFRNLDERDKGETIKGKTTIRLKNKGKLENTLASLEDFKLNPSFEHKAANYYKYAIWAHVQDQYPEYSDIKNLYVESSDTEEIKKRKLDVIGLLIEKRISEIKFELESKLTIDFYEFDKEFLEESFIDVASSIGYESNKLWKDKYEKNFTKELEEEIKNLILERLKKRLSE